jgi:hypothetical protein
VDAEAHAEELVISMLRSRTYTVRGLSPVRFHDARDENGAAEEDGCRGEAVLAPGLAHNPQALHGAARPGAPYAASRSLRSDDEGLEVTFAGGRVEISAEALAHNMAPGAMRDVAPIDPVGASAGPPAGAGNELMTDSSPNTGQAAPDLGERVL